MSRKKPTTNLLRKKTLHNARFIINILQTQSQDKSCIMKTLRKYRRRGEASLTQRKTRKRYLIMLKRSLLPRALITLSKA